MDADLTGREAGAMQTEGKQSLYDRLGGVYSVAVVVDDFIDRIMVDLRLNANPRVDEAHHRVSAQGGALSVPDFAGVEAALIAATGEGRVLRRPVGDGSLWALAPDPPDLA